MATILVVEDERKIRDLVRSYLERDGHQVITTGSGAEAIALAESAGPDLLVLDLRLPDVPGEDVAREIRTTSRVPILMLTARSAGEDRIHGFELGADDYVTKPFSPRELVLRVQAILRRSQGEPATDEPVSFGGGELVLDESRREAFVRGEIVVLTPTEWVVLAALAGTPGRVYSRFELINRARGYEFEGYERTVDSHVMRVESAGRELGSVVLRFPGAGLSAAESNTRSSLTTIVVVGAVLSVLLALGVAVALSRRITRPIRALSAAAAGLEGGDLDARAAIGDAPGEIGELGRAFDSMAETIQRESALRRALVADVAHELRTPVTILQASCEALVDGVSPPSPKQLASLHEEVLRLGRLVGDLETLTSAEAARFDLETELVDLAAVAQQSADRLAPYLDAAELTLERRLEAVEVVGDAARLGQVVDNLLGNALKFTLPGVDVVVDVHGRAGDAVLVVADSGPGIPQAELPHVFERFWRGESAQGIGGSGVGLAVVAELVEAHNGRVSVSSDPGDGTRFTVVLPRVSS
jgi:signal transduction histidine kinase/CheY-like chemotaxis protein